MTNQPSLALRRRAFIRFLAGSPWVAAMGGIRAFAQKQAPEIADVIANPKEALAVMDFEEAARRKVMPGHWAYMRSGVDDDGTLRANRDGYSHVQLRPRRLHDATKVDIRTDLFGVTYNSPIFTCPTGGERSFHPDGELAVGRATQARGTMQMLSTSTSTGDASIPTSVYDDNLASMARAPRVKGEARAGRRTASPATWTV